ncbi:MAG: transcription elongation factor GreA [Chloracidobacterium sp.]|nr:transcription elongation factor GreA [Chloracidobacterium sp.]MCC6826236.1 transcription elongation factor GreA [Acidobacteriota bacterium]MCO5333635.1 transcription elongation factor GreA [Pyrinomonadaceae bacterium]
MEEVKEKLRSELSELEHELHHKLPKVIQHAREFGDLSENAEYKAAKERQSMVQARISLLQQRLMEVESIDISKIPEDRIAYGSVVVLFDLQKEEKVTYELVTSEESSPENGKISTVSPIGSALMGKEEGDEIRVKTVTGFRSFEITRVTTIHQKG